MPSGHLYNFLVAGLGIGVIEVPSLGPHYLLLLIAAHEILLQVPSLGVLGLATGLDHEVGSSRDLHVLLLLVGLDRLPALAVADVEGQHRLEILVVLDDPVSEPHFLHLVPAQDALCRVGWFAVGGLGPGFALHVAL